MNSGACPSCAGSRILGHPSGFTWQHELDCRLLRAEEATQVADLDRLRAVGGSPFARPPAPAEFELLAACAVPAPAWTTVRPLTAGIRRRSWAGVDPDTLDLTGGTAA